MLYMISVCLRTGFNPVDINRFRSHTGKFISGYCYQHTDSQANKRTNNNISNSKNYRLATITTNETCFIVLWFQISLNFSVILCMLNYCIDVFFSDKLAIIIMK